MSVSSLSATIVSPRAAPPPAANATGQADAQTPAKFAQILSQGKGTARQDQDKSDDASAKADSDKADDADQDATALPVANAGTTTDPASPPVHPVDLTAAANDSVSAVLALMASTLNAAPLPPTPPKTPAGDTGSDTVSAAASAAGMPASTILSGAAAPASTTVTPTDGQKGPVDFANLSEADQQLLRTMMTARAPKNTPPGSSPDPADAKATGADISAMATALRSAFGQAETDGPVSPAIPAAAAAAATAPAASAAVPDPLAVLKGDLTASAKPATAPSHPAPTPQIASATPAAPPAVGTTIDSKADGRSAKRSEAASGDTDTATGIAALATADISTPAFSPSANGAVTTATDATTTAGIAPTPSSSEQSVTRHLDLARDTQWLDNLAHDISQAAAQNSHLKFQLNPEHLGSLQVEITNSAAGASVRMTTDNDTARAIIADAQPRLMAEVRAQGVRIAESHVDMGNQNGSGSPAGQRQSSEDHKPFVRTMAGAVEEVSDSPPRDDELYA